MSRPMCSLRSCWGRRTARQARPVPRAQRPCSCCSAVRIERLGALHAGLASASTCGYHRWAFQSPGGFVKRVVLALATQNIEANRLVCFARERLAGFASAISSSTSLDDALHRAHSSGFDLTARLLRESLRPQRRAAEGGGRTRCGRIDDRRRTDRRP